jgi:hypothetical protein
LACFCGVKPDCGGPFVHNAQPVNFYQGLGRVSAGHFFRVTEGSNADTVTPIIQIYPVFVDVRIKPVFQFKVAEL